jgi:hypothetical protein
MLHSVSKIIPLEFRGNEANTELEGVTERVMTVGDTVDSLTAQYLGFVRRSTADHRYPSIRISAPVVARGTFAMLMLVTTRWAFEGEYSAAMVGAASSLLMLVA